MLIPADLTIDVRQQEIRLASGGRTVIIANSGRVGPFVNGPIPWSLFVLAYVDTALAQFEAPAEKKA